MKSVGFDGTQESPQRKQNHAQRVEGWAVVEPDSFRLGTFRSPTTGQEVTRLCFRLSTGQVWCADRNGYKRAENWIASAYMAKMDQDEIAEGRNKTAPSTASQI